MKCNKGGVTGRTDVAGTRERHNRELYGDVYVKSTVWASALQIKRWRTGRCVRRNVVCGRLLPHVATHLSSGFHRVTTQERPTLPGADLGHEQPLCG